MIQLFLSFPTVVSDRKSAELWLFCKVYCRLHKNGCISLNNGPIFNQEPPFESSRGAQSPPKKQGCALIRACALIGMNTVFIFPIKSNGKMAAMHHHD